MPMMVAVSSTSFSSNSQRLGGCLAKRLVCVILLVAVWTVSKQRRSGRDRAPAVAHRPSPATPRDEEIQGVPVLWAKHTEVCGVLFLAHGCSHSRTDFFAKSESCPDCVGLPSELSIVDIALEHNLLVVAASSHDRVRKCWNGRADGDRVAEVLAEFGRRYPGVPIWAFGASSGGGFVSRLAQSMDSTGVRLSGFISQISANAPLPLEGLDCAVYVTMNRDVRTDERAGENLQKWLEEGSGPAIAHIRLAPLPVTDTLFSDRIPHNGPDPTNSWRMVEALRDAGHLDEAGFLREDPRRSDWRSTLRPFLVDSDEDEDPWFVKDEFVADRSALSEIMNVAYSQHEMTPDGVEEGLRFCVKERSKKRGAKSECSFV